MSRDHRLFDLNRRNFLRAASFAGAALAFDFVSEAHLAYAQKPKLPAFTKDAVFINANENPLGPSEAARAALLDAIPQTGRYRMELDEQICALFASQHGLPDDHVLAYAGSSQPLHYTVLAFAGPGRPMVMGDPGYEAAADAARISGAPVIKVPLTKDCAHDVRAMVAASPRTGVYYITSPNNPTGTLTSRADIEWLLANKPAGSVLLLDEAYIHFSDATPCLDLAAAGKDIVVLRTFSKIYGMAGARLGFAIARPDLLKKVAGQGGWTMCPVGALLAGMASLKDESLVPQRKKINADVRQETFDWLAARNYTFTPSVSNCFMLETHRPTQQVIAGMAAKGVYIGRPWPVWPTHVRITVGTRDEMLRFRTAFEQVMA